MNIKEHPAFKNFLSLNLSKQDYAIFGSGPMFAYGIRKLSELDDLDIVVNNNGWRKVQKLGTAERDDEWNCEHLDLFNGEIEIWNGWGPGIWDLDFLIRNAVEIGGMKFVSLDEVIEWKKQMGRLKDFEHIKLIKEYFIRQ